MKTAHTLARQNLLVAASDAADAPVVNVLSYEVGGGSTFQFDLAGLKFAPSS